MKIALTFFLLISSIIVTAQNNISEYLLKNGSAGANTYAIIIANEDYQSAASSYVGNDDRAIFQAERFQQMLIKTLGIPSGNILFYPDALNTSIKLAIARLQKTIPENSSLIFYYRGKTFTDAGSGKLYLVPVDVSDNETFYMFGLDDLIKRLSILDRNGITVLIDSSPGKISGSSCIIDNDYEEEKISSVSGKYLSLIRLKSLLVASVTADPIISEKPEIIISDPSTGTSQTSESSIVITGKVRSDCPAEIISVNGQEAPSLNDGSFLARIPLNSGDNNIVIEAKNCAGWTKSLLVVTRLAATSDKEIISDSLNYLKDGKISESGRNFAVIIGVSKYLDAKMPDLYYPIFDAGKVRNVLIENYTFDQRDVFLLINPVKEEIIRKLDSLNTVIKSVDNLLVFYAGHGSWDEKNSMGYWLPSDAVAKAVDSWIMNSIITGYAGKINARHTLIIADACFAGGIFRTRAFNTEEEKTIPELYFKTSKKAMTSGDLTEVPDESVFVKNFILLLSENKEKYLPSEQLFFGIKPKVLSNNIIPQFGILKNAGDQGGDFIFFRKKSVVAETK